MLYSILLSCHVISGFFSLLLGIFAIATEKGSKYHRISGKLFVLSMVFVALSAIIMTNLKPNQFLFSIAVFTLFLVFAGVKSITYYRSQSGFSPSYKEKVPFYFFAVFSLYMIGVPIVKMISKQAMFISVSFIFGLILLINAINIIIKLENAARFGTQKKRWLLLHIGNISGAYISTVTAFLVTNIQIAQWWIIWLAPTLIGFIFIAMATRKWSKKLNLK